MRKIFCLFSLLVGAVSAFAQNTIEVRGRVTDENQHPTYGLLTKRD